MWSNDADKIPLKSISADAEKVEDVVGAGFPAVVERLLELRPEERLPFLVGEVGHEGLAEVLDVLEAGDFR